MENTEEDLDFQVTLKSRDGKPFLLNYKAAKLSGFVRSLDEIFGFSTIECSRVSSNCLGKVVEFLNHYEREAMKTIKTPLVDHTFEGVVKQTWYREYVQVMDDILLSDMIDAAKFMDIEPLLDLAGLALSFRLINKSATEIKSALNAPQLSEETERNARRDYPWIFEDKTQN